MLKFFLIGFIGVFLPGPDMLLVFRTSLNSKMQNAFLVLFGILTGNMIYLIPVLLGISFYLKDFINYFLLLGSIYIIYIGISSLNIKASFFLEKQVKEKKQTNYYFLGLFTNLSNPKAMFYFASVLLPAFQKEFSYFFVIYFFMGVVLAFISIIFIGNYLSSNLSYKFLNNIQIMFSLLFIFYGFFVLWEGLQYIIK